MFDSDNILIWELFVCNDINRNWHVSYQAAVFQNSVDDGWTLISFLGILNLIHIRLGYWPYNELKHGTAIIRFVVQGHNNFPPSVILGIQCYILIIDQSRFSVMLTFHMPHCFMGLSPDTQNCGLRMRRECRERFPHHCGLAIPICVTHVPWCMPGSLTSGFFEVGGGENVPGIPGACSSHNFAYLAKGQCMWFIFCTTNVLVWNLSSIVYGVMKFLRGFFWKSADDRWIPLTKAQSFEKRFHVLTLPSRYSLYHITAWFAVESHIELNTVILWSWCLTN